MNWWRFAVIAWLGFSALATVGMIGKLREPLKPSVAVVTVIITAALIFCVVRA